ncbi:MAG TPA: mechanosensitive ion channel family protein [Spirochaetota bacterium]|nr:mechanosensitive ion channel family protein [Spirochaetota bacterium]
MKKFTTAIILLLLVSRGFPAEQATDAPGAAARLGKDSIESSKTKDSAPSLKGTAVIFEGKKLLRVHSNLGPFSPQQRAAAISSRLKAIRDAKSFESDKLIVISSEFTTDIIYNSAIIMSITPADAEAEGTNAGDLATGYAERIKEILKVQPVLTIVNRPSDIYTFFVDHRDVIIKSVIVMGAFILLLIILFFLSKVFARIYAAVESRKGTSFRPIIVKGSEIISDETVVSTIVLFVRGVRLALTIGLLYAFISVVFMLFPWAKSPAIKGIIKGVLLTVLTAAVGIGIYKTLKMAMDLLRNNIAKWKGGLIRPVKLKTVDILTEDQIVEILKKAVLFFQVAVNLFLLYIFIPIVFSFFEFTSTWADTLFGYILSPLKTMASSFIGFLPNLFFIAVIILANRYLVKLTRLVFDEIAEGNIRLPNFHRDWADPTYKIVRSLIIIFTLIVVFPYLPGSQSEAFKGVSIFLGILFSLGSTSVIANVVAGTILTYMYAFKLGDRVKIGDTTGDVIEKTLLVTRIRTIKNIVITIPNSIVMGSHIINYSTSAAREGLILHSTVTLGYDVPWRKVHEVLKAAALATEHVKKDPVPFVLQTSLDDFYVSYEINCYTDNPGVMARTYSELHQNIQDKCNEAGIEILSPHYAAARDGNATTIPAGYIPAGYEAPPFAVKIVEKLSGTGGKKEERKKRTENKRELNRPTR